MSNCYWSGPSNRNPTLQFIPDSMIGGGFHDPKKAIRA